MSRFTHSLPLLLLLVLPLASSAQGLGFGFRGDFALSKLTNVDSDDFGDEADIKWQPTYQFNGLIRYDFERLFGLQAELFFAQRGVRLTENYSEFGYTETYRIDEEYNYLGLSILPKLRFGTERFRATVTAGPYAAFMASGRWRETYEYCEDGFCEEGEYSFKFNDQAWDFYNRVDVGVTGGVGLEVGVGPGSFFFDARYNLGFLPVVEDDGLILEGEPRNQSMTFGLGYMLFPGLL
ncbi:MAG: outer membrane beta-barrel protein [Bacteroidota bacterium]